MGFDIGLGLAVGVLFDGSAVGLRVGFDVRLDDYSLALGVRVDGILVRLRVGFDIGF